MEDFRLQWHPQFSVVDLQHGGALFLGEEKQKYLETDDFVGINRIVDCQSMMSDYVFQTSDIYDQVNRLEKIDALLDEELIIKVDNEKQFYYSTTDDTQSIEYFEHGKTEIYLLSSIIHRREIVKWLSHAVKPLEFVTVVVDDYLDPRLLDVCAELKVRGKEWVLMKPAGKMPMVGPCFSSTREDAPCYHCLRSRLILNQPVREWYRRQDKQPVHTAIPILHDEQSVARTFAAFSRHYFKEIFNADKKFTTLFAPITAALADGTISREIRAEDLHPVTKRPQCRGCGNPTLVAEQMNCPVVLHDGVRNKDVDGGYRTASRSETIVRISPLISPITGILTALNEISDNSIQSGMSIYRSAYHQNTYSNTSFTKDTFMQLSLGKGVAREQAKCSALGEALERQAAQYMGDEPTIYATPQDLNHRLFAPQQLTPFSPRQYRLFAAYDAATQSEPQWVREYDQTVPINWVQTWSLTYEEPVYVPAAYCFANTPFDDQAYSLYTHNGNAAGNSIEEAILQGTLELIERDAVAIWWYNQIPRPQVDLAVLPVHNLQKINDTLDDDWQYWVLDISHDIGVVTCVAVGLHRPTEEFVLGFGSHLDSAIAGTRALTEMYQLITIKDKVTGPFDFSRIKPHPFLFPKRHTDKLTKQDYHFQNTTNIKEDIIYLVNELKAVGLELCVLNYSRPDIPLQTIKVIVPGLCHFWPQYANDRLYKVPLKLGWLSNALEENELNPLALYL